MRYGKKGDPVHIRRSKAGDDSGWSRGEIVIVVEGEGQKGRGLRWSMYCTLYYGRV
jgi:hypothetical protein